MPTILVVDDEQSIVELLAEVLGDEGYEVVASGNGREALQVLSQRPIDGVISDLMMPLLDGIGLWHAMQAQSNLQHLPFVLMTAVPDRLPPGEHPYTAVISKPFRLDELLQTITRAIRR